MECDRAALGVHRKAVGRACHNVLKVPTSSRVPVDGNGPKYGVEAGKVEHGRGGYAINRGHHFQN